MKTGLLASIAFSLFYIQFGGIQTRVDDAWIAVSQIDSSLYGDVFLAGTVGPVVLGALVSVVKAIKGEKNAKSDGTNPG